MTGAATQRWCFTEVSPLGNVRAGYELSPEGLRFFSDAPFAEQGSDLLPWDSIAEAATAVVDLPAGKGGPDLPRWMPGRLEWLLISRRDGQGRAVMHPLPADADRDALIAALRGQLAARWIGERMALEQARARFGIGGAGEKFNVFGLVIATLVTILVILVVGAVLFTILYFPALFALGGWLFYRGLAGLREAIAAENTPISRISSAAMGLVALEGTAVTATPSPAGVSGIPSVRWDVGIDAWQSDSSRRSGRWRQIAARHGGSVDTLVIRDATGQVPLWLRAADLILTEHFWHAGKEALPPPGRALLAAAGIQWDGATGLRVREKRLEAGGPVYVLGTFDEARNLPRDDAERGLAGLARAVRTGSWKSPLVRAMPGVVRQPVAVAITFFGLFTGLGRGGERAYQAEDAPPPELAPADTLVWKGRAGRCFVVADRPGNDSIRRLRQRSLWSLGIGAALMCYVLYELLKGF